MQKKLLTPILLLLFCNVLQAKESGDTSYLPDKYYSTFGNELPVYTGRLFLGYSSNIKGSPFIPATGWASGSVSYKNILYNINALKLDVYTGELIIQTPTQFSIIPAGYRINAFKLGGKQFIRIDSTAKSSKRSGFYEVLITGRVNALAKRNVMLDQKIEQLTLEYEFLPIDEFFIQRDNQFIKVSSQRELYEILKEKKKPIKKALRPLGLNFRKNKETLILKAVEIYNQN